MKKSVYSLVLMDDVIKAVDRQAYLLGTSRSNLINQILAEHLSCVTPEMRMKETFETVQNLISNAFQIQQQRSASLLTVRTPLEYKYRPTISYKVELERIPDTYIGTLKIQIRTQSIPLTDMFGKFFLFRAKLESEILAEKGCNCYSCSVDTNTFSRKLINSVKLSPEQLGSAIGEYIKHLDKGIKLFFADPVNFGNTAPEIEKEYRHMTERVII